MSGYFKIFLRYNHIGERNIQNPLPTPFQAPSQLLATFTTNIRESRFFQKLTKLNLIGYMDNDDEISQFLC